MSKKLVLTTLLLGLLTVSAMAQPTNPAPTPTEPANEVTSLFSDVYTNVTVDTWSAVWDAADVEDVLIQGNPTKLYTNLVFAGIEFTSQPIDASTHTTFHMDIWTPDPTSTPNVFKIKLVDFGADGLFGGGDDSEHELVFDEFTDPPLVTGEWIQFDIPMSDFAGLASSEHLAQLIIQADPGPDTVYMDNVYFSGVAGTQAEPTEPAPTPTEPEAEVISLFSNAYTDEPVDTWSADWDQATVTDIQIDGNETKLYTGLVFAGIEFTSQVIDVSNMEYFHMDIWTPDPTSSPAIFEIKLVDFGADGVWSGGDDSEAAIVFDEFSTPPLVSEQWISFDIPMADFVGLTNLTSMAQLVITSTPNTVYIDNIYWHTFINPPANYVLTMDPVTDPVIVPQGGMFSFDISVTNNTPNTGSGNLWTEAVLPNGNTFGPIINVTGLTLPAQQSFYFTNLAQAIPAVAPAGNYIYKCKIGYPGFVVAMDGFAFEVVASAGGDASSWNVSGTEQIEKAMDRAMASTEVPTEAALMSVYPNPFNPTTTVQLTLPNVANVQVNVFNSLGQQVATLASGSLTAGTHALQFNGANLASGLYFVRATVDNQPLDMQKLMLLK